MVWEAWEDKRARAVAALRENPRYHLPSWVESHARLLELLPTGRVTMPAPYNMVPDGIIAAARESNWSVTSHRIRMLSLEDYEDDEKVFDYVFAKFPLTPGPLWFIPHTCFRSGKVPHSDEQYRGEPYLMNTADLRSLVGVCPCQLTNADTLFIWCDVPRIMVIHHEDWIFDLTLPP